MTQLREWFGQKQSHVWERSKQYDIYRHYGENPKIAGSLSEFVRITYVKKI